MFMERMQMVVRIGDCTWSATGREGSADQKERPRAPVAPAREARKVYILLVVDIQTKVNSITTTAQTNKKSKRQPPDRDLRVLGARRK